MAAMAQCLHKWEKRCQKHLLYLEINPEHEMMKKLDALEDDTLFNDVAWILLDSAKLSEGLEPKDKGAFASRIANIATKAL